MKTSPGRAVLRAMVALVAGMGVVLSASFLYKALTYHEEVIRLLSSWGYEWNESFVREVVDSGRNPWIHVDYEIHEGQRTSSGAYIVDSDTLVLVVSGPRRDVMRAAQIYEERL
jgi:hypothetical protein